MIPISTQTDWVRRLEWSPTQSFIGSLIFLLAKHGAVSWRNLRGLVKTVMCRNDPKTPPHLSSLNRLPLDSPLPTQSKSGFLPELGHLLHCDHSQMVHVSSFWRLRAPWILEASRHLPWLLHSVRPILALFLNKTSCSSSAGYRKTFTSAPGSAGSHVTKGITFLNLGGYPW